MDFHVSLGFHGTARRRMIQTGPDVTHSPKSVLNQIIAALKSSASLSINVFVSLQTILWFWSICIVHELDGKSKRFIHLSPRQRFSLLWYTVSSHVFIYTHLRI